MDPVVQSILLGVVEGLTGFLPTSSTGHLIVADQVFGDRDVGETFTVVVQLGAILAVGWFSTGARWGSASRTCSRAAARTAASD